ncbi:MAG: hypothetical protein GY697_18585, partial [Desulfobacterales bacterium]|nr:hypothetical protein [Desulfobacterales bacterium]
MDLSLVSKNLKQLASTDLALASADDIKAQIISATRRVGDALPHHVVPKGFKGLSFAPSPIDSTSKIVAIAGTGFMGFTDKIHLSLSNDVIIYEPLPGLAYLFLSQIDFTDFFGNTNIHIFSHIENFATALQNLQNCWRSIKAFKAPTANQLFPEEVAKFQNIVVEYGLIAMNEIKALEKHYFQWVRNESINLQQLQGRPNASSVRNI